MRLKTFRRTPESRFRDQGVGGSNPLSREILKHLSELSVGAIGRNLGKREAQPHPLCRGLRRWLLVKWATAILPTPLFLSCPAHGSGTGRRAPIWRSNWVARLCSLAARSERSRRPWRSDLAARSSGVHLFYKTSCSMNAALRIPTSPFLDSFRGRSLLTAQC